MSVDAKLSVSRGTFVLDVEVQAADGELVAVLGPNGAGKTTLLRALAGLLPIDRGRIVIGDRVVDDAASDEFVAPEKRSVGVVFQDYLLFTHLSALDNVAFGLRAHGVAKPEARARARALLDAVDMGAQSAAKPRDLSGGQQQRVSLARALAIEPALLLLDEPLAALDVQNRVDTRQHFRAALADFPGARVLVTHDPIDALTLADRLVIIEGGVVVQEGAPGDVLDWPRSAYVAELAGVNLYRGQAAGEVITIGRETITAADPAHGDVIAIIPPHAVVLHLQPPQGSARNVWPGTIAGIERLAGRVRVRITGPLPIVAEVTPASVREMGLVEGLPVWSAVKATEVEVQPA